jgi:hypothetical protein
MNNVSLLVLSALFAAVGLMLIFKPALLLRSVRSTPVGKAMTANLDAGRNRIAGAIWLLLAIATFIGWVESNP